MSEIERLAAAARTAIPGLALRIGDEAAATIVRAVLQAMREPSPGMAEAAQARQVVVTGDEPSVLGVRSCWRAMIDHILSGGR